MIGVIAYLAHSASLSFFPYSSVLKELSLTPRKRSSTDITEDLTKMFIDKPVEQWSEVLDNLDIPKEIAIFALWSTAWCLTMPFWLCNLLITGLTDLIIAQ